LNNVRAGRMGRSLAWALLGTALAAAPGAPQKAVSPEDSARALHLLGRTTFGVRPADLAAVLEAGRSAWLERQLDPGAIDDSALEEHLASLETLAAPIPQLMAEYAPRRRPAAPMDTGAMSAAPPNRRPQRILGELVSGKLIRSVHSQRQLEEVMTDFWFNHFNVYFAKNLVRFTIADYERVAIRPHVFGHFEEMLLATARHPAMLFYLDNWRSVAPGRVPGRGLNENYARELLELHTLGVDGGYTQDDVVTVARALTGWTFVPPQARRQRPGQERGTFIFNAAGHDRDEKTILGMTLPAGRGIEDGEDVLRVLARHPSTATFLATKLVERFVSDTPDPAFIDELAQVYLRTDGSLREVTRALFTSQRFYDHRVRGAKVKTPFELVASALRATGIGVQRPRALIHTLRAMGHLPYSESAPTGFPAASDDWVNSGALLARMNFALELTAGRAVELPAGTPEELLALLMPGTATGNLADVIRADLTRSAGSMSQREQQGRAIGLALGSPAFQRR
jgi:uncharacterized protein (DUF1800 family)